MCFMKKVLLEISQNSQRSTSTKVFFLVELQAWGFFEGFF